MSAAPANNRFTYKVHRQDRYSVSTPPSSRPTEAPAPAIAPNTANALPRSLGSANVLVRIDSADGAMTAANAPWQARAVTSMAKLTDAPPTADATAKPARPTMKVTLRPARSASRPPSSSRLPNASAYAVTTHCLSTVAKCSDRCADGSATFTIVRSRTIMSWATATVARISQRLRAYGMFSIACTAAFIVLSSGDTEPGRRRPRRRLACQVGVSGGRSLTGPHSDRPGRGPGQGDGVVSQYAE